MIQWLAREMESPVACGLECSAQPVMSLCSLWIQAGGGGWDSGPSEGGSHSASPGRGRSSSPLVS